MTETAPVHPVSQGVKTLGIVIMVLGLLAILAPMLVGFGILMIVGALVLIAGIGRLAWAFQSPNREHAILRGLFGALTMICGVLMLTNPIFAAGVMTVVLSVYLLLDGVLETIAAFRFKPAQGWPLILLSGVLSIVLGALIWSQFPLSGAWAIGIFFGIKLIMIGMLMMTLGRVTGDLQNDMHIA
ncbi:MAG: HdeD family acid-resistance protein [Rubinisphaera brasiliensis]|uniref:HdeD family acid-resistance protein n=1 Tax=Rubinisphaera brasiliensis TaxID=119 RepID=UPI000C3D13F1|nr:hypothetical protein [Planctomyces sp.]